MNNSTELNDREFASRRKAINRTAGFYLCDSDLDCYEQYEKLVELSNEGHGDEIADNVDDVIVWEKISPITIDSLIELIESSLPIEGEDIPDLFKNIDWGMLRKQKLSLLAAQEYFENKHVAEVATDLQGIINLIDGLQDTAVDVYGFEEEKVFQLNKED